MIGKVRPGWRTRGRRTIESEEPFADNKGSTEKNRRRAFLVTREVACKVLEFIRTTIGG